MASPRYPGGLPGEGGVEGLGEQGRAWVTLWQDARIQTRESRRGMSAATEPDEEVSETTKTLASVSVDPKTHRGGRSIFSYDFVIEALGAYGVVVSGRDVLAVPQAEHVGYVVFPGDILTLALALGRDAAPRVLGWAERALMASARFAHSYSSSTDSSVYVLEQSYTFKRDPSLGTHARDPKETVKLHDALEHIRAWARFERDGYIEDATPLSPPSEMSLREREAWLRQRPKWTANMHSWGINYDEEVTDVERANIESIYGIEDDDAYDSALLRAWGQRFRNVPRADLIDRLEQSLYLHGALNMPPMGWGGDRWETAVMISVRGVGTKRVLFLCSLSEENICEPGCWCAGSQSFVVSSVFVSESDDNESVECKDLIYFNFENGEAGGMGEGTVQLASQAACDATAVALGIAPEDIGVALRVVVLAANVRRDGFRQWDALEMQSIGCPIDTALDDGMLYEYTGETEDGSAAKSHAFRRFRGGPAVETFPRVPMPDGDSQHREIDGDIEPFKVGAIKFMKNYLLNLAPEKYANLPTFVAALRLKAKYRKPVLTPFSKVPMTTINCLKREQARLNTKAAQQRMFGGDY